MNLGSILTFIAIILGLAFLIFIHEFGHYLAARICNIRVTEFFLGFGPKLWSFKRGETTYGIAAILLGGYVRLSGENVLEDTNEKDERGLNNASLIKKILIIIAGPAMNLLTAFIILAVVFGFTGVIKATNIVGRTLKNKPAEKVLRPKDKIIQINGVKTENWTQLSSAIRKTPNEVITLKVARKEQIKEFRIKTIEKDNHGFIGIEPLGKKVRNLTFVESIKSSGKLIYYVITATNGLIYKAITGQPTQLVRSSTSIIGAVVIGTRMATNVLNYLYFIGSISLILAYVNLLPVPPLDAGRIVIYLAEKIKGRPLKKNTLIAIMSVGFSLLMVLMVYLMAKDLIKYIPQIFNKQ